jgi:hypothetical protein
MSPVFGEVMVTVSDSWLLSAVVVLLLTSFIPLFCSTHPADKRTKLSAMIIHFMLQLKLLKEYNSFSQKVNWQESKTLYQRPSCGTARKAPKLAQMLCR